jgi:hypothetical protein
LQRVVSAARPAGTRTHVRLQWIGGFAWNRITGSRNQRFGQDDCRPGPGKESGSLSETNIIETIADAIEWYSKIINENSAF